VNDSFEIDEVFTEGEIKAYTLDNFKPEEVFDVEHLEDWAKENGYIKKGN
jgi:hypothetical protein